MNFESFIIFRKERFSIGIEKDSGKYFVSFPVFNGMVEYSEYYEISNQEYAIFNKDIEQLREFVAKCKNHKEDFRLIEKPGSIRGEPC
jgi:hypothetical protein